MRSKQFSRGSTRQRKIGMHFLIPIFLFLCGLGLIVLGGWNLISQTYFLSKLVIQPPPPQVSGSTPTLTVADRTIKYPKLNQQFGNIFIPTAGINYPLIHGDYDQELRKGVGHFDGSVFPGEGGNIVLDGHRETVFRNLGKVKLGDMVTLTTSWGVYKYKVTKINIIKDTDNSIINPTPTEIVTMYTCYPFNTPGYKPDRYVVQASLVDGTPLKELKEASK